MSRRLVLSLVVWAVCLQAGADMVFNGEAVQDTWPATTYLEDPDWDLTIEEVVDSAFLPLPDGKVDFGYSPSRFWVKFSVRNAGDGPADLVLRS